MPFFNYASVNALSFGHSFLAVFVFVAAARAVNAQIIINLDSVRSVYTLCGGGRIRGRARCSLLFGLAFVW